jgi:hypothetical protein
MSDADDLDVRTYVIGFRDPGVPSYEGVTFTLQGACDTARREGHRAWLFRGPRPRPRRRVEAPVTAREESGEADYLRAGPG